MGRFTARLEEAPRWDDEENRWQVIQAPIFIYPSPDRTLRLDFVYIVFTTREAGPQLFGNGRATYLSGSKFAQFNSRDARAECGNSHSQICLR